MPTKLERTILIVEAEPDTLKSIEDYLGRAGYDTRTATNGWEAIKCLKDGNMDLVISDASLADADGASLREKFLLNPGMRDVPFLYLVDEDHPERQIPGLRNGVDDYVRKPCDPVVLVARVQASIERRRIYEEMVRVDPLTRLLNRPTLENEINEELERVRRYNRFASLVLIDLDDFNRINVEQGQAMGDLLLTCLSGIIMTNMRNIDIAGRYRGEKFMLYLPETRESGAYTLVDRIQDRFRKVSDAMTGLDITFSSGIVETPRDSTDLDQLCSYAEDAARLAKEESRGKIILWAKEIGEPGSAKDIRFRQRSDPERPFDI